MESQLLHLAEEAQDCCSRVQAQVLAKIAAAGDLDDILGLDDKPELAPA